MSCALWRRNKCRNNFSASFCLFNLRALRGSLPQKKWDIRCGHWGQMSGPCWKLWWGLGVAKRNWSNAALSLCYGVSFELLLSPRLRFFLPPLASAGYFSKKGWIKNKNWPSRARSPGWSVLNMEITTSNITIVSQYYCHGLIHGRYIGKDSHLGLLCCSGHLGPILGPPYPRQVSRSDIPVI